MDTGFKLLAECEADLARMLQVCDTRATNAIACDCTSAGQAGGCTQRRTVQQFALERREETLDDGVVPTIAEATHTGRHAARRERGAVGLTRVTGGFKRSSQHLLSEMDDVEYGQAKVESFDTQETRVPWPTVGGVEIRTSAVLGGDSCRVVRRRRRARRWRVPTGGHALVSPMWWHASFTIESVRTRAIGAVSVASRARGCGVRVIARALQRSPSTISRGLRRDAATRSGDFVYRATIAQWHTDRAALRPKVARLASNARWHPYVAERLAGAVVTLSGVLSAGPQVAWNRRRRRRRWARRLES